MSKRMDWSLIGGIATIIAGAIVLYGSRIEKKQSDGQLEELRGSLDSLNIANKQLSSLLSKSNDQVSAQTDNITMLNKNLEPFIGLALQKYPDKTVNEALEAFKNDLEKFDKKINQLSVQLDATKSESTPLITGLKWLEKNQRITEFKKGNELVVIKDKFNVDHLVFNSFELQYSSKIKLGEFVLEVQKNDIVDGQVKFHDAGILASSTGHFVDNQHFAFVISNPWNGKYEFKIYSKTPVTNNLQIRMVDRNK